MKKSLEKYDLVKVSGILVLLTIVLSWVIPQGYFQEELIVDKINRISLISFLHNGVLSLSYFANIVTFLFVLGGFYQVLAKTGGYQALTKKMGEMFKGNEVPLLLVLSFLLAISTSTLSEYYSVVIMIPFINIIGNKLKFN